MIWYDDCECEVKVKKIFFKKVIMEKDTHKEVDWANDNNRIIKAVEEIITTNRDTFWKKIEDALKARTQVSIWVPWTNKDDIQNLTEYVKAYAILKDLNSQIDFFTEEVEISEADRLKNLEIARNFVETNKDNPIISLIFKRVDAWHRLDKPFEIGTGWDIETCKLITAAVNLVLEEKKAGFRVKIIKEGKKDKSKTGK